MCADDHIRGAAAYLFVDLPFLFCGAGSGKKNRPCTQSLFLLQAHKSLIMLPRQHLCRHHKRRLIPVFSGKDHGKKSNDRFSAAHISLHKSGHQGSSCKIPFNLMPGIHLGAGKIIRQSLDNLLRSPGHLHGKMIFRFFRFFFQQLHRQDKKKKLIKNKPFSCGEQFFHIPGEVYCSQSKIDIGQLISLSDLIRKIFRLKRTVLKSLADKFRQRFVCQSGCEPVNRLHIMNDLFISCRSENFRMLQFQLSVFSYDPSAENKNTALFQHTSEIRRIKPYHVKSSAFVADCDGDDLKSSGRIHINAGAYCSGDGFHRPLFQICNILRHFIYVIISGIISKQTLHIGNSCFVEKLFRFFSHTLQSS